MKKVLAILAIAGFLAACNNKSEKKEEKDTSTVVTPPVMDTMKTDTVPVPPMDTMQKPQ